MTFTDVCDLIYEHQEAHARPPERIEITNEEAYHLLNDLARPGQKMAYAGASDNRPRPAGVVCWIMGVPICRSGK